MTSRHLPFADWMKATGMAFIVWGHVAAGTTVGLTTPFNVKQLGVAFFVFLTGFTLARERRSAVGVVFARYFEVFVWGLLIAVVMSGVGLVFWNDPNPSNFLPLAGGLNLLQNGFPANPTTWYIGTYLHLLLLWALLLRGRTVTRAALATWLPAEIVVRAAAFVMFGPFVAYMLLSNWTGVLLLGILFGQRPADAPRTGVMPAIIFVLAWPIAMNTITWTNVTFPFMTAASLQPTAAALLTSACVTAAYLAYTLSGYALLGRLGDNAVARFLARNTVIVFIVHMPLYYLLEHVLSGVLGYAPRVVLEFVLCYAGLALVSEGLRRVVNLRPHRDRLLAMIDHIHDAPTAY